MKFVVFLLVIGIIAISIYAGGKIGRSVGNGVASAISHPHGKLKVPVLKQGTMNEGVARGGDERR